MIHPNLFKQPVAVDSIQHRQWRLASPVRDWDVAKDINAIFVASVEFGDVCGEYPIVFVEAGQDADTGKALVAPIAVLGLVDGQNVYIEQGRWRAGYIPALLRAYPFGIARQDANRVVVVLDEGFGHWSQTEGEPLFDGEGKPSEFLGGTRDLLERLEAEIQRTQLFGKLLVELDLLQPMRFDATLPDGRQMSLDGFLTLDEKKFAALPDDKVVELHRNGVLGLLHAHQISLRQMRRLVEWHAERLAAEPRPQV